MSSIKSLQIRREERAALLQRAIEVLTADARVVAAWLFGSMGRGDADDLSDIDLWLVVSDEHIDTMRVTRQDYVHALGTPLLIEEAPQNAPPGGLTCWCYTEGRQVRTKLTGTGSLNRAPAYRKIPGCSLIK